MLRPCDQPVLTLERIQTKAKQETTMNILILGSGGREHSLAWAIQQNP
ncbi:MAG: hypothetical protein ACI9HB_000950, partial [Gammaproteobacteria bacterium]